MIAAPWGTTDTPRALVFGGLGFLGRHITAELRTAGFAVMATTRRPVAGPGFLRCDPLCDSSRNLAALIDAAGPSVVVNCTGDTTGDTACLVDANVTVPARLLAAVAAAAPYTKFVHLGSAGEYGATATGRPLREDAPCEPASPYAISKLAGTRIVAAMSADAGVDSVVLRVFNPIGAGSPPSSLAGRAARLLREAAATSPHPDISMASLDSYRDWIDARDVGRAVAAAALAPDATHHLYNVGSGQAVHSREVVRLLAGATGFQAAVREDRTPPARSGAVSWQQADISLAVRELGWQPRYALADSVTALCHSLR